MSQPNPVQLFPAWFEYAIDRLGWTPWRPRGTSIGKLTLAVPEGDGAGGQAVGLRTVLVRTGKFRPDELDHTSISPDGIVSSIAQLPDWLEENV